MIIVFHYPATYQFPSNYLTGALQMFGMIINAKYPGTTVAAQPQSQFLGGTAISRRGYGTVYGNTDAGQRAYHDEGPQRLRRECVRTLAKRLRRVPEFVRVHAVAGFAGTRPRRNDV